MPKKQVKQAAPLLETEQASPDQNVGETGMMPLSVTPCVRIRYGDRESKVAAQLLLARMQEEFGDEVRVVLRRNHDDENSPGVVVGLEFFGVSVQLSEPMLWSGQPADVEQKEWMDPAVRSIRSVHHLYRSCTHYLVSVGCWFHTTLPVFTL
jgi:hypothetical protein